jgi:hypothetical protein
MGQINFKKESLIAWVFVILLGMAWTTRDGIDGRDKGRMGRDG